ncbi:MAG: hypothetical protein JXN65_06100 [Clostridia bacterium]|nr:hypothetical protein [Clostridia bacterium]
MDREFIKDWTEKLKDTITLHNQIQHIDFSLEQLHPIAIVKNKTFYIFDYNRTKEIYELVYEKQLPDIQIPEKVLASFPLDFYNGKPAAVISEDALESLEKRIFIFHEFVHCFQYNNGEQEIKETLGIYKTYKNENNHMWEINHPFPYEDNDFAKTVVSLSEHYKAADEKSIISSYKTLKDILSDYEYLIWQEWKEGYARFVENNIRSFLKITLNDTPKAKPFDRSLFYWTGSHHIDFLKNIQKKHFSSLSDLFNLML